MNLAQLKDGEENPIYRLVEAENSARYYHFLQTLIKAALLTQSLRLSDWRIQAIKLADYIGRDLIGGIGPNKGFRITAYFEYRTRDRL